MKTYEVIESRAWRNNQGRMASIYGAAPYISEAQRVAEKWEIVTRGFTVRNNRENRVGIGRQPWATREEVQAWCDAENARLDAIRSRKIEAKQ